jgi:hypothetical protein
MTVEIELRRLAGMLRQPRPSAMEEGVTFGTAVRDPMTGVSGFRYIRKEEKAQIDKCAYELQRDLRFEYLTKPSPEDVVLTLAREVLTQPNEDHISAFVSARAHVPEEHTVYIPIESLIISQEYEISGVRFVPTNDPTLPNHEVLFNVGPPAGAVAIVQVSGTGQLPMLERARSKIGHAVRILRLAFGAEVNLHARQLRFRMGASYAFDANMEGVHTPKDVTYQLGANTYLFDLARSEPVSELPASPTNDLERHANIALHWMERAYLEGDPLAGTLFAYFAFEALLGDTSNKRKGEALAFRQMVLGHLSENLFNNPVATQRQYELIRSAAVHGSEIPEVNEDDFAFLLLHVRKTLNQYLAIAKDNAITKRSQLVSFLENHAERSKLIQWVHDVGSFQGNEKVYQPLIDYLDVAFPDEMPTRATKKPSTSEV